MSVPDYLPQLSEAVQRITAESNTDAMIRALKEDLKQTEEPFI